jgi:hypothetical protein
MSIFSTENIDLPTTTPFGFMSGYLLVSEQVLVNVDFWHAQANELSETSAVDCLYDHSQSIFTCLLSNHNSTLSGDLIFIQRYHHCIT